MSSKNHHRVMAECLSDGTLVNLAEGTLDGEARGAALLHIQDCVLCADLVAQATRLSSEERRIAGRYLVYDQLGVGGMGQVHRAYDELLHRDVALKVVRADRGNGTETLHREAEALAQLNHPHVVKVFDVLRDDDEVVIAMELIEGITLDAWLAEKRSTIEIVRTFIAAGQGLHAAHLAGILHRDFKPSNVMVSPTGNVTVLDFGLATRRGDLVWESAGTPLYMAPEQYEASADARSDQYEFCLTLLASLTGRWPFATQKRSELRTAKMMGRLAPDAFDGVSRPLQDLLRVGLDPEPDRRWPDMATVVGRLIDVVEQPARRRRVAVAAGASAVVLMFVGGLWNAGSLECSGAQAQLAGIWDDARRAEVRAAVLGIGVPYAEGVWERTRDAIDSYAEGWARMHLGACEATAIRAEQSQKVLDLRMACLQRAKGELAATADVLAGANAEVIQQAHHLVAQLPTLSRCADVEALEADVELPSAEERGKVEVVRGHIAAADAARHAGQYAAAQRAIEAAEQALEGLEHGPVRTEVARAKGAVLEATGEYEPAAQTLEDALDLAMQWQQRWQMAVIATRLLNVLGAKLQRFDDAERYRVLAERLSTGDSALEARFRFTLGSVLRAQGEHAEAETEFRQVMALRQRVDSSDPVGVATARQSLGNALYSQGKYEEAETEHRRALEELEASLAAEHPQVAAARESLGNNLLARGKHAAAEDEFRRALAIREQALDEDHADLAATHNNLGNALFLQGDPLGAEERYRRALAIQTVALGPDHPHAGLSHGNIGNALSAQGKHSEAEAEYRRALTIQEAVLGPDHPEVAGARHNLANALHSQGKLSEAEEEYRAALSLLQAAFGPEHDSVARSYNNVGYVLQAQRKHGQAEDAYRRALKIGLAALGADHPFVAKVRTNLAITLLDLDEVEEAETLAGLAWDRRRRDGIPLDQQGEAAFVYARALAGSADAAKLVRARALAERSREIYQEAVSAGVAGPEDVEDVRAWLDGL